MKINPVFVEKTLISYLYKTFAYIKVAYITVAYIKFLMWLAFKDVTEFISVVKSCHSVVILKLILQALAMGWNPDTDCMTMEETSDGGSVGSATPSVCDFIGLYWLSFLAEHCHKVTW
jgi:hypothetical protein